MKAWREMATDSFAAVGELVENGRWRSAVSRAYYAAYARVVADLLDRGLSFGPRGNPTHRSLPQLVLHNMPTLNANSRATVCNAIDGLFRQRLVADYSGDSLVDPSAARGSITMMSQVFRIRGRMDGP